MSNNDQSITKQDLNEAFDRFAQDILIPAFESIDERFNAIDQQLVDIKYEIADIKSEISAIKTDLAQVKTRLEQVSQRSKEDSDTQGADLLAVMENQRQLEKRLINVERQQALLGGQAA